MEPPQGMALGIGEQLHHTILPDDQQAAASIRAGSAAESGSGGRAMARSFSAGAVAPTGQHRGGAPKPEPAAGIAAAGGASWAEPEPEPESLAAADTHIPRARQPAFGIMCAAREKIVKQMVAEQLQDHAVAASDQQCRQRRLAAAEEQVRARTAGGALHGIWKGEDRLQMLRFAPCTVNTPAHSREQLGGEDLEIWYGSRSVGRGVVVGPTFEGMLDSRRRDFHFTAAIPSPSLLKLLLQSSTKGRGGCSRITVSPFRHARVRALPGHQTRRAADM